MLDFLANVYVFVFNNLPQIIMAALILGFFGFLMSSLRG